MKMKEISIALMEIFESVEMMEQLLSKISTEEKRVLFSVYAPTRKYSISFFDKSIFRVITASVEITVLPMS